MTDEKPTVSEGDTFAEVDEFDATATETAEAETATAPPQYGVWPFSIREVVLIGIWAVAFVFSFFSLSYFGFASVWTFGLSWVLTIGLPTVAVFLLVLRRLSPQGIRRVGSLGIDQFASVAFSVSALVWLQMVWEAIAFPRGLHTWVHWAELLLMLAGVVFTVVAPVIPGIRDDFAYRDETVAHPVARPLRPIAVRPTPAPVAHAPAAAAPYPAAAYPAADTGAVYPVADTGAVYAPAAHTGAVPSQTETGNPFAPLGAEYAAPRAEYATPSAEYATPSAETSVIDEYAPPATQEHTVVEPEPRAPQAFWALVPEERDVLDETGVPAFRIDPTAWALVIEDRGEVFVVRHEDGRIGYLHDVSGVTRG